MKTQQIRHKNTQKLNKSNVLVAHANGDFSYRIGGQWTRRVSTLPQSDYLALLRDDRQKIVLAEFYRGRIIVEGTKVIVSRPVEKGVCNEIR